MQAAAHVTQPLAHPGEAEPLGALELLRGEAVASVFDPQPQLGSGGLEGDLDPGGSAVLDRVLERFLQNPVQHQRGIPRQRLRPALARHLDRHAVPRRDLAGETLRGRQQAELVEDRRVELVGHPVQVGRERARAVGERRRA